MAISSSPAIDLLFTADMQGKAVYVARLRSYCAGPSDVADKLRTAHNLGIKVKGLIRHDEQQELLKLRGGYRVLKGVL